jgi:hypothetical protein
VGKLVNRFSWSLSRRKTFERCKRAYWFSYYGHWGGWEAGANPRTRKIWRLKQLTTRAMWVGSVVHEEIARVLHQLWRGQPVLDPEEIVEQTIHKMRSHYRDSMENNFLHDPKRHTRFLEHEYRVETPRERWKESADRAKRALRNFFASEIYAQLSALDEAEWLEVEDSNQPPPLLDVDGFPVYVRVDLAFRDEGRVTIVDWKTGKGAEPDGRDQLAGYALYAQEQWDVPAAMVRAREINVVLNRDKVHELDGGFLDEFRVRLARSVADMHAFLEDIPSNRAAPEDEFPYCVAERECRFCFFVGVCPRWEGNASPWDRR